MHSKLSFRLEVVAVATCCRMLQKLQRSPPCSPSRQARASSALDTREFCSELSNQNKARHGAPEEALTSTTSLRSETSVFPHATTTPSFLNATKLFLGSEEVVIAGELGVRHGTSGWQDRLAMPIHSPIQNIYIYAVYLCVIANIYIYILITIIYIIHDILLHAQW